MNDIIKKIQDGKIIAIVRDIENHLIVDTAKALYKGGISLIEVTFNHSLENGEDRTILALKKLNDELGDKICIGAGTVMNERQVELAVLAGAKYIISPTFDRKVILKTLELGAVSIPGVFSPTEIVEAYEAGANFVKIFPCDILSYKYLKAIRAPINYIPMLAVGGIDYNNINDFMDTGIDGVGIGSSLVNRDLIIQGRFDELTKLARKFVEKIG